ncbi:hypothetical protein [Paenibacillus ferrarius]|nr:hypothetical protein [Paenibacillus ferrarius]
MLKKANAKRPILPTDNPVIIHNRYCFLMWARTGNKRYLTMFQGVGI